MKKTLAAALLSSTLLFGTASVVEAQEQGTSEDDTDDSGKLGLIGLAGLLGLAGLAGRNRRDDRRHDNRYGDERSGSVGTR